MKTFIKSIFKSITNNLSRFISMILIILVGICFITGVGGITPKLENSLNQEFKRTNIPDIIMKSKNTSGFSTEDILKIASKFNNIETLTSYEITLDEKNLELRYIDIKNNNVNKLKLLQGKMPTNSTEVLILEKSNTIIGYNIGDTISYNSTTLKVTGIVSDPLIFSKDGPVNNMNEHIDNIIYFDSNYSNLPKTDILIDVDTKSNDYFSDKYFSEVKEIVKSLENENLNSYYLTLKENKSFMFTYELNKKINVIALIFPIFFITVVALVILTNMTKVINEERKYIACYKSLGYKNSLIMTKYIIFALIIGIIGLALGLISGAYILPNIIYNVFKKVLFLPKMTNKINIVTGSISSIFMLIAIILVTIYVSYKDISDKPANLFRPKSPKDGKIIFLEKIKPIWNKLSFKYKSCYRNIFRYKGRLLMIIISILGSTALVMAGLGLYNLSEKPIILNGVSFNMGNSIKYVSLAVIVFALLLTILVLYNITSMNIEERNREIATLKVLGYKNKEVCLYIFREIIQLSLFGVILGIPTGLLLLLFIMNYLGFGNVSDIKISSYFLTLILVTFFIILVNFILIPKILKVNMNDSLKSID